MQVVSLEGRYAPRKEGVVAREVAGEMVIVDMQSGMYHGLNPVGVMIWEALDGDRTLGDITTMLAGEFPEVSADTIEADTLSLLQALLDHELVVAH